MYLSTVTATKVAFWQEIACLVYVSAVAMSFILSGNKGLNNEFRRFEEFEFEQYKLYAFHLTAFEGAAVGFAITHALQLMVCCREGENLFNRNSPDDLNN